IEKAIAGHHKRPAKFLPTRLQNKIHRHANTGVSRTVQVVIVIEVIDVNLVAVTPARRQGTGEGEPISVILKTRVAGNDYRTHDAEAVIVAEVSPEVIFRNARMVVVRFFIADVMCVMLIAVVVLLLTIVMAVVMLSIAVFVMVVVMVMLREGRHSGGNSKRQERSKTDSNQFHVIRSPSGN